MQELDRSLDSFDELHTFVHQTLCESENLLADQFETKKYPLVIKDRICAIEYRLHGPRSLKLAAIWAADTNVIYFYNALGERNLKVQLTSRLPTLELDETSVV